MGFFDRVKSFFGFDSPEVDFGDDRLNQIWEELEGEVPRGQKDSFIDDAVEAFQAAYVDTDIDDDARAAARSEFEALCSQYSVDIADFDWDAWRDWYNSQ